MFCLSLKKKAWFIQELDAACMAPSETAPEPDVQLQTQKRGCCRYATCLPFQLYYENSCDFPISSSKQKTKPNSSQRLFAEDPALQEEKQETPSF